MIVPKSFCRLGLHRVQVREVVASLLRLLSEYNPEGPYTLPLWNWAPKTILIVVLGLISIIVVYMDPLGK